jgi:hemolysin D
VIQAFEPGVVKAIHVRDGDKVDRDDLLIELDETEAVARMRQVENELDTVRSQQARLDRLRQYIKPDSETGTDHTDLSDASERALLNREREQHAAQLAQLAGQRLRHEEELGTVEARIAGLRGIHDLVAQRGKALEKLSTVGHVSTEAWLKVAQEQRGIETELAVLDDRQYRSGSGCLPGRTTARDQRCPADSREKRGCTRTGAGHFSLAIEPASTYGPGCRTHPAARDPHRWWRGHACARDPADRTRR